MYFYQKKDYLDTLYDVIFFDLHETLKANENKLPLPHPVLINFTSANNIFIR